MPGSFSKKSTVDDRCASSGRGVTEANIAALLNLCRNPSLLPPRVRKLSKTAPFACMFGPDKAKS